jgi:hypothetical protein
LLPADEGRIAFIDKGKRSSPAVIHIFDSALRRSQTVELQNRGSQSFIVGKNVYTVDFNAGWGERNAMQKNVITLRRQIFGHVINRAVHQIEIKPAELPVHQFSPFTNPELSQFRIMDLQTVVSPTGQAMVPGFGIEDVRIADGQLIITGYRPGQTDPRDRIEVMTPLSVIPGMTD